MVHAEQPFDLWVGLNGSWIPVEVKSSEKAPLKPSQRDFIESCHVHKLPYFVIRDLDDVPVLLGSSSLAGKRTGSG